MLPDSTRSRAVSVCLREGWHGWCVVGLYLRQDGEYLEEKDPSMFHYMNMMRLV